jgi:PAS domain S-box-containing protein
MAESNREQLSGLWRRLEEVRGLSQGSVPSALGEQQGPETLTRALRQLVDELEQSHRRLIETQVQWVSLRELAGALAGTREAGEAARVVVRYLRGLLDFDQVALLLVDRERGVLTGTWSWPGGLTTVEVPLARAGGAVADSLWATQAIECAEPARSPALVVPHDHPLAGALAAQGSYVCVPLEPASGPGAGAAHPECEGCALRASPGGESDVAADAATVEDSRAHCARCPHLPLLGVLVVARGTEAPAVSGSERLRLDSVGFALAPMVENTRLVHELSRSQRFLADVLDSMPSALIAFDTDARALSLNRTAQELLRVTSAEAEGCTAAELLGEEGEGLIAGTLDSGLPVSRRETMLRPRSGPPLPVRLTTSRLRDANGRAYGVLATFLDLTPLRAAEERARQLDRLAALGRFTSSVAHEIRNPLTGIGMGVRRLSKALDERPGEAENVEFVLREIRRLDGIVQELFDVTHPRHLDLRPRSLEETVRRAERSLAGVFETRELRVSRDAERELPDVPHDADQMQQVFINLLKNAAEATTHGGSIRVRLMRGVPPAPSVVVTVADTGCGMDAETQKKLFEPFFTTKATGTGLGLYVTHDIVKRHGGTLTVTSAPGEGAIFTLELPLDPQGGSR